MSSQVSVSQSVTASTSSTWVPTLAVLAFGVAIIFAVGFLPMEAAHNAAHDTRHAMAFPCH